MDRYSRLIGLVFVIAWTIFRLVRYLRAGSSRRPSAAVPGSAGMIPRAADAPASASTTVSPIEPARGGSGFLAGLLGVLVLLAGNAAVWACLFLVPQLDQVPVMLRLVIGVLANFYLLYLARTVAAAVRARGAPNPPPGGNPIS
jgi:hypothetical protein